MLFIPRLATIPSCFICWGNSVQKCCDCNFTGPNSDVYYCTRCSETFHGNPLHPDRTKHNVQDAVDFGFMSELDLLSVICIETSHYVCFTRDPTAMDEEHKWIFFDSMANRLCEFTYEFVEFRILECIVYCTMIALKIKGFRCSLYN